MDKIDAIKKELEQAERNYYLGFEDREEVLRLRRELQVAELEITPIDDLYTELYMLVDKANKMKTTNKNFFKVNDRIRRINQLIVQYEY